LENQKTWFRTDKYKNTKVREGKMESLKLKIEQMEPRIAPGSLGIGIGVDVGIGVGIGGTNSGDSCGCSGS